MLYTYSAPFVYDGVTANTTGLDKINKMCTVISILFLCLTTYSSCCNADIPSSGRIATAPAIRELHAMLDEHKFDKLVIVNLPISVETFMDTKPNDLERSEYKIKLVDCLFQNSKQEKQLATSLRETYYKPCHVRSADFRWECILYRHGKRMNGFFLNQGGNLICIDGKLYIVNNSLKEWFHDTCCSVFTE